MGCHLPSIDTPREGGRNWLQIWRWHCRSCQQVSLFLFLEDLFSRMVTSLISHDSFSAGYIAAGTIEDNRYGRFDPFSWSLCWLLEYCSWQSRERFQPIQYERLRWVSFFLLVQQSIDNYEIRTIEYYPSISSPDACSQNGDNRQYQLYFRSRRSRQVYSRLCPSFMAYIYIVIMIY